jgi:uncharacterized membrane protein
VRRASHKRAQVERRHDVSDHPVQLFVASYDNEVGAKQSLKDFQAMHRQGSIDLIDAAVIVHSLDGKVTFEETADPSGKRWAIAARSPAGSWG